MMGTRVFEIVCPHRGCGLGARSNEANLTVRSGSTARELLSVVAQRMSIRMPANQLAQKTPLCILILPPLANNAFSPTVHRTRMINLLCSRIHHHQRR